MCACACACVCVCVARPTQGRPTTLPKRRARRAWSRQAGPTLPGQPPARSSAGPAAASPAGPATLVTRFSRPRPPPPPAAHACCPRPPPPVVPAAARRRPPPSAAVSVRDSSRARPIFNICERQHQQIAGPRPSIASINRETDGESRAGDGGLSARPRTEDNRAGGGRAQNTLQPSHPPPTTTPPPFRWS